MTNFEKYKDDIINAVAHGDRVGVKDGELIMCDDIYCTECIFYDGSGDCGNRMVDWLNAEYVEPVIDWSKVPIDTKVLCRDKVTEECLKRHFAGINDNGRLTSFKGGRTSWTNDGDKIPWTFMKLADPEDEKRYRK